MVKPKNPKFWNGDKTEGCDDWEEVVKWVNGLSKFGLMGVPNKMLLFS